MSVEKLRIRIKDLENELKALKVEKGAQTQRQNGHGREKIAQMSSEVVDSNPYRLGYVSGIFYLFILTVGGGSYVINCNCCEAKPE